MLVDQKPISFNERISPEYLALQKQLHETNRSYGTTSGKLAEDISALAEKHRVESILDYGCGKGQLKAALGDIVREYDPGIPGKDEEPEVGDMVVCTDVLEHIEPDRLGSVLEHIRQKCRRVAYFTIAMRPAGKTLADGRNAHLIIEGADWWRERLAVGFDIQDWNVAPNGKWLSCVARPYLMIGQIEGVGVMSNDDRFEFIKENIKVTDKRLTLRKGVIWKGPMIDEIEKSSPMFGVPMGPARDKSDQLVFRWAVPKPHNRVAIIMCYGPSLEDTWGSAIVEQTTIANADIVSVSGAHDYLLSKGIVPKYHVECDPRKHKGDMIAKPHPKVEYLMASCVHPEVVAKLKGCNLTLWHMNNGKGSERVLDELEPHALMIPGGGSVGLRAIVLMYVKGYRRFIIHGMDCSYRGERSHAGHHTGKKIKPVEVVANGMKYLTAPVLITYMRYFEDHVRRHVGDPNVDPSKIEIILRGDGLLQHWLIAGGAARRGEMPTSEAA